MNILKPEIPGLTNKSWLKGAVIYGANASGKSSVIEAMAALKFLVIDSASITDPQTPTPYISPFAFASKEEPTAFRIEIAINNIKHELTLAVTRERVIHESLKVYPNKNGASQTMYQRKWDAENNIYKWSSSKSNHSVTNKTRQSLTLKNMLYLSRAVSLGDEIVEPIFRWFKDQLVILNQAEQPLTEELTSSKLEDDEYKNLVTEFLKSADLGITNLRVTQKDTPIHVKEKLLSIMPSEKVETFIENRKSQKIIELEHTGPNKKSSYFPWKNESFGTRRLFSLLGPWIDVLVTNRVIFVDELENSFHPNIVRELIRVLMLSQHSTSQLIFSTHCSVLLDEDIFRRDQIWFTEKDTDGKSELYPLTKFKPRNDESLVRGYLAGRYGGTPFIPVGLFTETTEKLTSSSAK